jgi:hypothetical protein
MAKKPSSSDHIGIIERVSIPLAFILVLEAILGLLCVRATGMDRTILIVGMLLVFALLVAMVFVLTREPQSRSSFAGNFRSITVGRYRRDEAHSKRPRGRRYLRS